ncbi:MAG: tetratricopeptide repeat protein, partial [Chloroflexia bacterium]
ARHTCTPLVWYQLDAADNDPGLFLQCLVAALRTRFPSVGRATMAMLEDPTQPSERSLAVLLNETVALEKDILLVLEDYHSIHHPEIHRLVQFLVDHQPPQLHLVISTREEPPIGLGNLRAAGELLELRGLDLRFTAEEIRELVVSRGLSETLVPLLEERTEGWPAGLQLALAALAQRPESPADEVLRHFRGSHRFVFDYLAEEVFERQPPEMQEFLLRTAILDQVSVESCRQILGIEGAETLIEQVERRNLFLVRLDEERRWYRYHQLFRDFLLDRLERAAPEEALRLHRRAGDCYAEQGLWNAAAEHYMAAHSAEGLSRAIRALAPHHLQSGRLETLYRYLLALPPSCIEQEPDFAFYLGQVFRQWGRMDEALSCFERARALYEAKGENDGSSRVLTEMAYALLSRGEYAEARRTAETALSRACPDDHLARSAALMALARSTGFLEGMDRGYRLGEEALREARAARSGLSRSLWARFLLSQAEICWWYGDPFATVAHCQAALEAEREPVSPIACRANVIMVSPYLYWGDLDTARELAERGLALSEQIQYTEWRPMAHAALGAVLSREGKLALGERHLREAILLARRLGAEAYAELMATGHLAANLSAQGRLAEARQCCEEVLQRFDHNR